LSAVERCKAMRRLISRSRIAVVMFALAVVFESTAIAQSTLPHLRGISELRDWFNAGKGHVRLILLLSPT
jgi:hypothetical protein